MGKKKRRNTFKRGSGGVIGAADSGSTGIPFRGDVSETTRIVYHEAGHAVMNVLMGLPFIAVSLADIQKEKTWIMGGKKIPMTEGVIWTEERKVEANEQAIAGLLNLREAIAAMAGPVCEAMIVGELDQITRHSALGDTNGISACCRAAVNIGKPVLDWKPVRMEAELLICISIQALDILTKHESAINAVAKELAEKKYLMYAEVVEIMSATVGCAC